MKRNILLLIIIAAMAACNSSKQTGKSDNSNNDEAFEITDEFRAAHSSANSLDWAGVYKGTLPCADCEGIVTEIRLNSDNTYEKVTEYFGKGSDKFRVNGTFEWDEHGGKVKLIDESSNTDQWFQVGENRLIALDIEGNKIEGSIPAEMYNLIKIDMDNVVTEKYWKLIELGNRKFDADEEQFREPHFILHCKDNRITGATGCNSMMGSYELSDTEDTKGNISFSQLASTRMACMDIDYEQDYLDLFNNAKSYSVEGGKLTMLNENGETIALFEAVYLR